jgi:tetratricopeptide (TPR) repeat protein
MKNCHVFQIAAFGLALWVAATGVSFAQSSPNAGIAGPPSGSREPDPGARGGPVRQPSGPEALAAQPLPSTARERAKLLDNLYAYLATADSDAQARPIALAIERLWLFADSDTIGLLMDRSARAVSVKNLDLAIKLMDSVVDLAPDYAEGWNRRAYVHYLRNDVERMVGDLRRCLALEPNHYRALDGLAQILRETGQKKAALKAYQRLIEVHPTASGAQDALKDLSRDVDGQKT